MIVLMRRGGSFQKVFLTVAILSVAYVDFVSGFAIQANRNPVRSYCFATSSSRAGVVLKAAREDEENEMDLVPVRRRGRRRAVSENEESEDTYYGGDSYYSDATGDEKGDYFDEDFYQDLEDAIDDWDIEDEEDYDLFGNEIIPNPLLDSIDPDGAAERFPELARDPRFWVDMALFLAFLAFLSDIGPRDTLPDIPLL